jgi:catechol 2,3-dioxygenase-like lactoylglutathione lyase family enzyme
MLGRISFGFSDLLRSARFYDEALAPLGYVRVWSKQHAIGFGERGGGDRLTLFAKPGQATAPGPGFHLAFDAPNPNAVDAFHAAALRAGGQEDCGKPGLRAQYGLTYYAAFVVDPDGHKLEAVNP